MSDRTDYSDRFVHGGLKMLHGDTVSGDSMNTYPPKASVHLSRAIKDGSSYAQVIWEDVDGINRTGEIEVEQK